MSVYFQEEPPRIIVRGKTYPYRDLMRSLGGEYLATEKTWSLPLSQDNLDRVSELCKSVGGGRSKEAPLLPLQAAHEPSSGQPPVGGSASAPMDGLSISELMQKMQLIIAQGFPRSIWVLGEIQNIRMHASGVYFQLADFKEGASRSATLTVSATLWRSQLAELERKLGANEVKDILQDGQRVRLLVDVTLYKDRGQVSLQVQGIDPTFTKGSLALAREKLLRELRAKGLDRRNKSLAVSSFPLRLGLISASGSRAQSDFMDQLQLYRYPGEVIFYPAQMQGEKTLEEVVKGIAALAQMSCDMIIITRGGGSAADLRWFDSAEIAYAIAACPLPIVAAIGHHEDICIAEEICLQREKTPTAAADFVISLCQRTKDRVSQLGLILSQRLEERLRLQASSLQLLRERIMLLSQRVLTGYQQQQGQITAQIELHVQRRCLEASGVLQQLSQRLGRQAGLRLQNQEGRGEQLRQQLSLLSLNRLQASLQELPQLQGQLAMAAQNSFYKRSWLLAEIEKKLLPRDPRPWMAQGWTQLSHEGAGGRILGARELRAGMRIRARLPDALLDLTIDHIQRTQAKD